MLLSWTFGFHIKFYQSFLTVCYCSSWISQFFIWDYYWCCTM